MEHVALSIAVEYAARVEVFLEDEQVLEQLVSVPARYLCIGGELIESDGDETGEGCQ